MMAGTPAAPAAAPAGALPLSPAAAAAAAARAELVAAAAPAAAPNAPAAYRGPDLDEAKREAAYRVDGMETMDAAQYRHELEQKLIRQQMARKID